MSEDSQKFDFITITVDGETYSATVKMQRNRRMKQTEMRVDCLECDGDFDSVLIDKLDRRKAERLLRMMAERNKEWRKDH